MASLKFTPLKSTATRTSFGVAGVASTSRTSRDRESSISVTTNARTQQHYGPKGRLRVTPTMTKVTTILLNGHPTWAHLPKRKGPTIVLLHGGMSSSGSLLKSIGPSLAKRYRVAAFDRRGHGRTADTDEPFSYDAMADETIAFIEHLRRRVHLVGHSDGGNIALLVAMRRPDLVRRVVAIGANYHYKGLLPVPVFDTESEDFAEWAKRFGEHSPDGAEHARAVEEKTRIMTFSQPTLTTQDLATISVPVLVMAGDDDVATLAHTCSMYESIPQGQLSIVPGTSHMLLKERTKESVRIIEHFLRSKSPPVTLRAAAPRGHRVTPVERPAKIATLGTIGPMLTRMPLARTRLLTWWGALPGLRSDALLYGLSAVFALGLGISSAQGAQWQWGYLATGPYALCALLAYGMHRLNLSAHDDAARRPARLGDARLGGHTAGAGGALARGPTRGRGDSARRRQPQ